MSMTVLGYLLILAPIVAMFLLWRNFSRRIGEREQESGVRWEELVTTARTDLAAPAAAVMPTSGGAAGAPATSPFVRRARTLDPAQTLFYYLLKNSLPDHEVMPRVTLDSVLELATDQAGNAEQQGRQLTQQIVDFLVCDKTLQPVAAIDLRTAPATPDFKIQCLAQAGIRYLQIQRTALPKRDRVRQLVLGA